MISATGFNIIHHLAWRLTLLHTTYSVQSRSILIMTDYAPSWETHFHTFQKKYWYFEYLQSCQVIKTKEVQQGNVTWGIKNISCAKRINTVNWKVSFDFIDHEIYLMTKASFYLILTRCSLVWLFYALRKHQKTFRFSDVFRGNRKATPGCNGLMKHFHKHTRKIRLNLNFERRIGFRIFAE